MSESKFWRQVKRDVAKVKKWPKWKYEGSAVNQVPEDYVWFGGEVDEELVKAMVKKQKSKDPLEDPVKTALAIAQSELKGLGDVARKVAKKVKSEHRAYLQLEGSVSIVEIKDGVETITPIDADVVLRALLALLEEAVDKEHKATKTKKKTK